MGSFIQKSFMFEQVARTRVWVSDMGTNLKVGFMIHHHINSRIQGMNPSADTGASIQLQQHHHTQCNTTSGV